MPSSCCLLTVALFTNCPVLRVEQLLNHHLYGMQVAYFETRTGLGLGPGLGLEENPDSRKTRTRTRKNSGLVFNKTRT